MIYRRSSPVYQRSRKFISVRTQFISAQENLSAHAPSLSALTIIYRRSTQFVSTHEKYQH